MKNSLKEKFWCCRVFESTGLEAVGAIIRNWASVSVGRGASQMLTYTSRYTSCLTECKQERCSKENHSSFQTTDALMLKVCMSTTTGSRKIKELPSVSYSHHDLHSNIFNDCILKMGTIPHPAIACGFN